MSSVPDSSANSDESPTTTSRVVDSSQGECGPDEERGRVGARPVHRGGRNDRVVPGGQFGHQCGIGDITGYHAYIGQVVYRRIADHGRHLVTAAQGLRDSLPASSSARPENDDFTHAATVAGAPVTRRKPVIVRAVRRPLAADMFDELCPSSLSPIRFGDKWAGLIHRCLEGGPRRFSELRVPLRRVTPKVLTQSLRALQRDGFITRVDRASVIEYELTPLGRRLWHPWPLPAPGPRSTGKNCSTPARRTTWAD
jgi:DNA-binding HxlR family transcriptional regulator